MSKVVDTRFIVDGAIVNVAQLGAGALLKKLPANVYEVQYSEMTGFYLSFVREKFATPQRVYGNSFARVDKVLNLYNERTGNTGVLMTGDKGTGKTLLLSLIANAAIERLDIPVIQVTQGYHGSQFLSFIQSLGEVCLVFDEFAKTYSKKENQETLLSLLDGADKVKRLTILTENNQHSVSEYLINRPGRIFYHFKYGKLDEQTITEYCADNQVSPSVTRDIIAIARSVYIFSFDMLAAIVDEHKRHRDVSIKDVVDEFAKTYSKKENQETLLSLLDGADKVKRLTILTENNQHSVSEYLINRPGRIFYHFKYGKLDEQTITEYCADNQVSPSVTRDIIAIARSVYIFSFDMLAAIVDEHKRHRDVSIKDVVEDLNVNIKPRGSVQNFRIIGVINKNTQQPAEIISNITTFPAHAHDGVARVRIRYQKSNAVNDDKPVLANGLQDIYKDAKGNDEHHIWFSQDDLMYEKGNRFVFDSDGWIVTGELINADLVSGYSSYL